MRREGKQGVVSPMPEQKFGYQIVVLARHLLEAEGMYCK